MKDKYDYKPGQEWNTLDALKLAGLCVAALAVMFVGNAFFGLMVTMWTLVALAAAGLVIWVCWPSNR